MTEEKLRYDGRTRAQNAEAALGIVKDNYERKYGSTPLEIVTVTVRAVGPTSVTYPHCRMYEVKIRAETDPDYPEGDS
jgi:hypothetical protein